MAEIVKKLSGKSDRRSASYSFAGKAAPVLVIRENPCRFTFGGQALDVALLPDVELLLLAALTQKSDGTLFTSEHPA